jgi:uncharacterized membrane protein YfcA
MNLYLFISAFIAEIAGTVSGFGSSSIFLPFANQFFDYKTALILVAIYHIFGNTTRLSLTYQHLDKRIFLLFGIPSILATFLGASLVDTIDSDILKIILAIVLMLFASYSLWDPRFHITPTPWIGRIGGAISGFTAWLIGTGWVLRGAFMTLFNLKKEQYIATIASIALIVDVTRIPLYLEWWFLDSQYYILIPILFCIAFLGSYIGKIIVRKIQTELLKKVILMSIILMSIYLGYQGGAEFFVKV